MESGTSNPAGAALSEARSAQLVELSADIVSAYVSHNALSATDLPKLISSVHGALLGLGGVVEADPVVELKPAVPVKKSITPEYLICLEDGKKFKSLKRHLRTEYDMSPEEYLAKWGLPPDYPMVAPTYSEARSRLAKTIGLGRKPKSAASRGRAKATA
jgi:predicted transcriptional regulator